MMLGNGMRPAFRTLIGRAPRHFFFRYSHRGVVQGGSFPGRRPPQCTGPGLRLKDKCVSPKSRRFILELPGIQVHASKVAAGQKTRWIMCLPTNSRRSRGRSWIRLMSRRCKSGIRFWMIAAMFAGCSVAMMAQSKDSFTPMPLDSGFGRMDVIRAGRRRRSRLSSSLRPRRASFRTR